MSRFKTTKASRHLNKIGRSYYNTYEECGRTYQATDHQIHLRPEYKTFVNWISPKSKVLDLGCGDGSLGALLLKKKCKVLGVEIDPSGVKSANKKGIKAMVGDIDAGLDFSDNEFDYATINATLHMVYCPAFVLKEALRVGKKVIVSFPNFGFWLYRLEFLFLGKFPPHSLYGYKWYDTRSIHLFSYKDFLSLIKGFNDVKITKTRFLGIDNRHSDMLSTLFPNLFSRVCILQLKKKS